MTAGAHRGAWAAAVDVLVAAGIDTIFGLPGDDLALLDALDGGRLRLVWCRDQRNAMFMAAGHALQSGRPCACVVGKGPALTNALTGLLEARASGAPVILLAGGTAADRRGRGAFQELDQLPLAAALTAWSCRVDAPASVEPALWKAVAVAGHPPRGPVYVELPDHLLEADVPADPRRRSWPAPTVWEPPARQLARAAAVLSAGGRPVVLVGGGMRHHDHDGVVERLAGTLGAAVVATASGRGVADESDARFCGVAGLYAPAPTRALLRDATAVLALGSRLEETATTAWPELGTTTAVVQVTADVTDAAAGLVEEVVVADAGATAAALAASLEGTPVDGAWTGAVARCHRALHQAAERTLASQRRSPRLHVAEVLAELDAVLGDDRVLVQENGLQDMWSYCYPFWSVGRRAGSVVPSEQTSLGFGAAAAAGVKLAAGDRDVAALVGDGAFAMVAADLATVARERIPVLYVVLDNAGYGWLQSQLDTSGRGGARFAGDRPVDQVPGPVHEASADTVEGFAKALRQAHEITRAGAPAVVRAVVDLADAPPLAEGPGTDDPTPR